MKLTVLVLISDTGMLIKEMDKRVGIIYLDLKMVNMIQQDSQNLTKFPMLKHQLHLKSILTTLMKQLAMEQKLL